MRVRAQVGMVMNLDKCIGCHTCSVTCKNVWTNRDGAEYMWFNDVETKPGVGYPKRWEEREVPIPVKPKRQQSLSIRWLIAATRSKSGRPMFERLADELMAAYRREGEAMSKRETTIKMAEANKAFSHFAW